MEIKDNMEHLSLSLSQRVTWGSSTNSSRQFHTRWSNGWDWGDMQGGCRLRGVGFSPGHLAGVWQRGSGEKWYACKIRTMGQSRVLRWFALLKSISTGQAANSRVGTRRGAPESFLFLLFWCACACVCDLSCSYLIHMLSEKKNVQKPWKFAKTPSW